MTVRIGDLLVRKGVLTGAQRDHVLAEQVRSGRPFGELAERLFGVTPLAIEQAWAEQYASITRSVDPMAEQAEAGALALIDRRQAWQFRLIPLRFDGPELMVCTSQEHLVRAPLEHPRRQDVDRLWLVAGRVEVRAEAEGNLAAHDRRMISAVRAGTTRFIALASCSWFDRRPCPKARREEPTCGRRWQKRWFVW